MYLLSSIDTLQWRMAAAYWYLSAKTLTLQHRTLHPRRRYDSRKQASGCDDYMTQ